MMKSFFSGSTTAAVALLSTLIVFDAANSYAVPFQHSEAAPSSNPQTDSSMSSAQSDAKSQRRLRRVAASATSPFTGVENKTISNSQNFVATAYSLRGRTASGRNVSRGIIAADRRVLPMGTRVRVEHGGRSSEYVVADTGGAVRGRKIDIWVPSTQEAMRFGRRSVKLTVMEYGRNGAAARPARRASRAKR